MKYETLLNTLDKICDEAPDNFVSYKVDKSNAEALNRVASKVG